MEKYNIEALLSSRSGQPSYHMVAEKSVRIEFRNLDAGQSIGPFAYDGNVIVTCYRGTFTMVTDVEVDLGIFDQSVIPHNMRTRITCNSAGTVQLIWSPPHAATKQGE